MKIINTVLPTTPMNEMEISQFRALTLEFVVLMKTFHEAVYDASKVSYIGEKQALELAAKAINCEINRYISIHRLTTFSIREVLPFYEIMAHMSKNLSIDADTGVFIRQAKDMNKIAPGIYMSFCPYDWSKTDRLLVATDSDWKPNDNWIDVTEDNGVWWEKLRSIHKDISAYSDILKPAMVRFETSFIEICTKHMMDQAVRVENEATKKRREELDLAQKLVGG